MQTSMLRILCVDEDADTCFMLTMLLRHSRIEVTSAGSLAKGLEMAKVGGFDLLLLDHRFIAGTGLELCRQIREFDRRTPIIFFTALASERERQRSLEAGAQAYLIKPDDLDKLADTIWSQVITSRQSSSSAGCSVGKAVSNSRAPARSSQR